MALAVLNFYSTLLTLSEKNNLVAYIIVLKKL